MDEGLLEARAYNNSIYLMVATPYLLLAGMGLAFLGVTIGARRNKNPPKSPPAERPAE